MAGKFIGYDREIQMWVEESVVNVNRLIWNRALAQSGAKGDRPVLAEPTGAFATEYAVRLAKNAAESLTLRNQKIEAKARQALMR